MQGQWPLVLDLYLLIHLSTYTGLDDYDTLFEARHGRGALVNMPRSSEEAIATSSIGMTPVSLSAGMTENLNG